jgi:phage terminase large subunit-like protein
MGKVRLKALAFDRYRIDDLIRELNEIGITTEKVDLGKDPQADADLIMVAHGQGFKDMSPAVENLETEILNGRLRVQKNPVMTMCAANAVITMDPAGSRKFDKRPGKSMGRIDGLISLSMALKLATSTPQASYAIGRLVAL